MIIGIVLSKTPGYSETFFNSKIKGLQKNGHQVVLFVQKADAKFDICEVRKAYPIYKRNVFKQGWWFLKFGFMFILNFNIFVRYIKEERKNKMGWVQLLKSLYINNHILTTKLDWLHFGFTTMALGKEHVAKTIGAKMAVSFRGFDMAMYPIKHSGCYDLIWKTADKIHSISDDLYALALNQGLSKNKPYQKITPAIDIRNFNGKIEDKDLNDKSIKVITIARLHWKKGLTYTLLALKQLKEKGINFQYSIVGEGEEFEKLMYLRHILDLEKEVSFLGKIPHEQIKELLLENSIYLQYSISEGFCNAVLEAQAMGLLCLVSDAEGLPENVLDGKSGWVVPKRAPEKLASKIMEVHNLEKHVKKQIMDFAINRVKQEFNLDKQQKEFIEFYK